MEKSKRSCWIYLILMITVRYANASDGACDLDIDRARLDVVHDHATADLDVSLYGQIAACWNCSLVPYLVNITQHGNCSVQLDSRFSIRLAIVENTDPNNVTWRTEVKVSQYGQYQLVIFKNMSEIKYSLMTVAEGPDVYIPIYVAIAVFVFAALIWMIIKYLYRRGCFQRVASSLCQNQLVNAELGSGVVTSETEITAVDNATNIAPFAPMPSMESKVKKRLVSLDAFRGLSLVIMIFVNYGGGGYWFLDHSYWNGLTVADLVFPWFTWIIGTAIALAFRNQLKKGITRWTIAIHVCRRTAILFALGLLLENHGGPPQLSSLRIPGVLQRLAITYFVVAIFQSATLSLEDPNRESRIAAVRDILDYWVEWGFMIGFVTLHLLLTFLVPIDDVDGTCPKGYLGPGGLHDNGIYANCTGGAAAVIDRWIFTRDHIYGSPTCQEVYETTMPHDPEGFLGTLTSIFMCFLGLQAGKILVVFSGWTQRIKRWLVWSIVLGLIAGVLCNFKQNDGWIPVNKNLWSLSFVLALSSMAFLLFTVFYLLIDVYSIWTGAPFIYPGMNSIAVYTCHMVFQLYFPVSWDVPQSHAALLAMHLYGSCLWTIFAFLLYTKQIFIAI